MTWLAVDKTSYPRDRGVNGLSDRGGLRFGYDLVQPIPVDSPLLPGWIDKIRVPIPQPEESALGPPTAGTNPFVGQRLLHCRSTPDPPAHIAVGHTDDRAQQHVRRSESA